ncbi:hypothetical protein [Collimonas sp. OK242]|uniref:hypothetical protein n=1 Tax=Collimonas sp. OK242 TaxID=1798195 RepID=UPI000B8718E3|nr:hypothetical protein [Collimonas sp. OK242]
MPHELWVDPEGLDLYCLAGPEGDAARARLPNGAHLEMVIEAESHFDAMTKYYEYRGYGTYQSSYPDLDKRLYQTNDKN